MTESSAMSTPSASGGWQPDFWPDSLENGRSVAALCDDAVCVVDGSAAAPDDVIGNLRKSRQLLDDIVENIPTAVQLKSVLDQYRVVMWNKAAESMYGLPRSEALGRNVHDLWPKPDADRMHASDLDLVHNRKSVEFHDRPAQTRDRGEIRVHMRKVPLYDDQGDANYLLVIADDVTQQIESAKALAAMQARFQRALDGSRDAIWEYEISRRHLFHSHRLIDMLRLHRSTIVDSPRKILRTVWTEDRDGFLRALRNLAFGDALAWEGRLRHGDGSFGWYRIRGTLGEDDLGCGRLASGTVTDIGDERRAREELRRHRDHLAELVEERTAGLNRAMQEAERSNRAKSEFLANISHELRTPMHAIVSFANFGVEKFATVAPERLLGYFQRISGSAARLLKLLNDLLDLSSIEAGRMTIQFTKVDVEALVRIAAEELDSLAQSRGIRIAVNMAEAGGSMHASWDAARMLQVLRNLIGNAVKFSPENAGAVIEVSACHSSCQRDEPAPDPGQAIEIKVRDHGIGIPEDELESVFDKFIQSSRTNSGAGGTGLGLAICREIVRLHGGTIRAESNPPPARGTVITLVIPVRAGAAGKCTLTLPTDRSESTGAACNA
jgi:PAS domain S-box-containing protein